MTDRPIIRLATRSPDETMCMAAAFASICRPNDVIGLTGTLGAGKTCFVKGLARGLGVPAEANVISPTFVLLRQYEGRLTLSHFDAYRLEDASAMEDLGSAEVFADGGVAVVEWADHVADSLPDEHFALAISVAGESERELTLSAAGPGPSSRLAECRAPLAPWLARSATSRAMASASPNSLEMHAKGSSRGIRLPTSHPHALNSRMRGPTVSAMALSFSCRSASGSPARFAFSASGPRYCRGMRIMKAI